MRLFFEATWYSLPGKYLGFTVLSRVGVTNKNGKMWLMVQKSGYITIVEVGS